jgi:hypothetical protein
MTTASVIQSHSSHLKFFTTLQQDNGITKCLKEFGPKTIGDGLVINAFPNVTDIRFIITSEKYKDGNNILKGCGDNQHIIEDDIRYDVFGHSSLPSKQHLSRLIRSNFTHETWNQMTRRDTMYEFSIVRAVSYEGSKDGGVGKGVIYAMSKNSGRFKRYDYVTVKVNIDDVLVDQVAQVLTILQVYKYEMKENKRVLKKSVWYLIVQYMKENPQLKYTQHEQLKKIQWERLGKTCNFSIAMINMDCLVGLATVIPCFSFHDKDGKGTIRKHGTPIMGKPVFSDVFWLLDRKFFDRSGWEELVIDTSSTSNEIINRDNMQSFINSNFIAPAQEEQDENEELYEEGDIRNFKVFRNEEEGDYY